MRKTKWKLSKLQWVIPIRLNSVPNLPKSRSGKRDFDFRWEQQTFRCDNIFSVPLIQYEGNFMIGFHFVGKFPSQSSTMGLGLVSCAVFRNEAKQGNKNERNKKSGWTKGDRKEMESLVTPPNQEGDNMHRTCMEGSAYFSRLPVLLSVSPPIKTFVYE